MTWPWIRESISICIVTVVIAIINALLIEAYLLVSASGSFFSETMSNLLFLEGGLIIVLGAIIEFFHIGHLWFLDRILMSPQVLFDVQRTLRARSSDVIREERSTGWMLIFLGGLLILLSVSFILINAK